MTISELIAQLDKAMAIHGDLPVYVSVHSVLMDCEDCNAGDGHVICSTSVDILDTENTTIFVDYYGDKLPVKYIVIE